MVCGTPDVCRTSIFAVLRQVLLRQAYILVFAKLNATFIFKGRVCSLHTIPYLALTREKRKVGNNKNTSYLFRPNENKTETIKIWLCNDHAKNRPWGSFGEAIFNINYILDLTWWFLSESMADRAKRSRSIDARHSTLSNANRRRDHLIGSPMHGSSVWITL